MSKPSSSRFFIRSYLHHIASKPTPTNTGISNFIATNRTVIQTPASSPWLSNSQRSHLSSSPAAANFRGLFGPNAKVLPNKNFTTGFRYASFKVPEMGSKAFAEKMVKKPALSVKRAFARSRGAMAMQIEAFWKRNYLAVLGAGGIVACILLWRILFGIASTFISFSEGMAKYGFLAFSSAVVAFTVVSGHK